MTQNFYTILTKIGKAKLADAAATGKKIEFTEFALGDGGGRYYDPTESATKLKNETWKGELNTITVEKDNPNWIVLEIVVPSNVGGFMIREAGVFDKEGDLIAIGKYPETYKPLLTDGSAKDLYIKMIIEVSNASAVNITLDPSAALATKKDINHLTNRVDILEGGVKRYGVVFEGSKTKGTRVENATGMIAQVATDDEIVVNDFDKVSFYNRPICCGYHDENGKFQVKAYRGEPGFSWDGSNGEVFYECTPFYYKGDLHNYVSVTASPLEGYKLAPMFKNGIDKVYCPVFPIAMVDEKATSRAGEFPEYGSINNHMTNARTYHAKAHTETMAVRISEYILMLVEFADKNLQDIMEGPTSMAYSSGDTAIKGETSVNRIILESNKANRFVEGQTVSIGTSYSSHSVAQNRVVTKIDLTGDGVAVYFDGDPVDIEEGNVVASRPWKNGAAAMVVTASSGSIVSNTDAKHPCIWRGKENPWGNGYSAICDVLVDVRESGGNLDHIPHFLEDPTKYDGGNITDDYIELNYKMAESGGYIKTLGQDKRHPHVMLPNEVGGSSSTYLADYYWSSSSAGVRGVFAGGYWYLGAPYGPVCFLCTSAPSSSAIYRLARLFVSL